MYHHVKLEQFEGPLDLLLQLIENEKLEITTVSLSQVTQQYIETLNSLSSEEVGPSQLADFLVIAARLLLIKSRALLPFLVWEEEEEEGDELAKQLKIYKEYLEATKVLQKILSQKNISQARQKMLLSVEVGFAPPPTVNAQTLSAVYQELIKGLTPVLNLPKDVIRRTISINEKISNIKQRLTQGATLRFSEMIHEAKDRAEVIVSFLALLELIKQRSVVVHQQNSFDDITIEPVTND
jgi:segregation and condensation protein A